MDFWIRTLDCPSSARTDILKYPLGHGDSILLPMGNIFSDSANSTIPGLLRFQSEKGKKGDET